MAFTPPSEAPATASPTSEEPTGSSDVEPAEGDLCDLFQEVKDLDDSMQREVNEVLAPLFTLDPATDDVEAEAEQVLTELQDRVEAIDREHLSEIYTQLAELVPKDLRDEAVALREGTLALIDVFLGLDADDLDDLDAQLATPDVLAAGVATLALDELSREECGITIAN